MKAKSIYINLPVKDLSQTRNFWTKLGFTFNPQFSNDKALCLVLKVDSIYSMLITHEFFKAFTPRPIADGSATQVLSAVEVESREQVDFIVKLALENGGTRYKQATDHGWMYSDFFADPDGHQWEFFFMDLSRMPK